MLGLGAYGSSSEDEVEQAPLQKTKQELKSSAPGASQIQVDKDPQIPQAQSIARKPVPDREPNGPVSGPVLGPAHNATGSMQLGDGQFSTSRTLIHDLTLPPVPNLDIPPSPPGSPNPSANAKFAHFLRLKKQDVHFNEKLAGSASLKNPSLLNKMMEHAGIDGQAQYSSSIPTELWDTSSLPNWGYKEELLKVQKESNAKAEEKRVKGQRAMIDFVSQDSSRPSSALHDKSRLR
ncbi:HCNGP-like protein-domain-containing protein [Aspergillus keveii]|uniref:HCNGP-like protein-domain-containing protein n=1 Tax=Aspergillus keveii TaxID=714993 RepID=A0ABR4G9W3_9EURO